MFCDDCSACAISTGTVLFISDYPAENIVYSSTVRDWLAGDEQTNSHSRDHLHINWEEQDRTSC